MTNNKWYVFNIDNYGHSSYDSYDTKEELEKGLSENYCDDDLITIVHGKEYKHEVIVKVVEE